MQQLKTIYGLIIKVIAERPQDLSSLKNNTYMT